MRTVTLSILLAAGAVLACPAIAQETNDPRPPETVNSSWDYTSPMGSNAFQPGLDALDSGNLAKAEMIFARALRRNPRNGAGNFYLGAVRMDLGKWDAAKKHLEIAVQKRPTHPDPKSRLGVTYAKLGDVSGAMKQRDELVKMKDACKGSCELSPYIIDGIKMIDDALAEPAATPAPQG